MMSSKPHNDQASAGPEFSVNPGPMLEMIDYLAARPSPDQIAQHLVLTVAGAHAPRAAMLSFFRPDGFLEIAGSFGLPQSVVESLHSLSLWDRAPMAEAARSGSLHVYPTLDELLAAFPWLEVQEPLAQPTAAFPLIVHHKRIGAMQLLFAESPDGQQLHFDLQGVGAVLALYLSLLLDAGDGELAGARHSGLDQVRQESAGGRPGGSQPIPAELSSRQLTVLRWMARGMTNSQIAQRVGFSESTVRQETMAIYRYLGANGRHQAVQMAGLRGLLAPQEQSGAQAQGPLQGQSQRLTEAMDQATDQVAAPASQAG